MKKEVDKYIEQAENIVIVAHTHPDPDAISSVLAMLYYVQKYHPKKEINVCLESKPVSNFSFLHLYDEIGWIKNVTTKLKEADLVIFLDGNQLHRFSFHDYSLKDLKGEVICIDHHESEKEVDFDYIHINTDKAATVQILTEELFGDDDLTDSKLGEIILVGIIGDTGKFKFIGKERADVLATTQRLVEQGDLWIGDTFQKLKTLSEKEFRVISKLTENIQFTSTKNGEKYTYSYLTDDDIKTIGVAEDKLAKAYKKYMGEYTYGIDSYNWGFVILPSEGGLYKISFRSNSSGVVVQEIAAQFGGGGHTMAAAGQIEQDKFKDIQEAIEYAKKTIDEMTLTPVSQAS